MIKHEKEDDGVLVPEWRATLGAQPTIEDERDREIVLKFQAGVDAYTIVWTVNPRPYDQDLIRMWSLLGCQSKEEGKPIVYWTAYDESTEI